MPANLPPQYFEAERKFREAKTIDEKISALEKMLAIMPKHKGTEKLQAQLKRKIAKLEEERFRSTGSKRGFSQLIKREGAGQIAIVGLPNCGKSTLLSRLTNAKPDIADYPFSTRSCLAGMMPYENIMIQLIDTPPLMFEAAEGFLSGQLRYADALCIIIDLTDDVRTQYELIIEELKQWKIGILGMLNETPQEGSVIKRAVIAGNKLDENIPAEVLNTFLGLGNEKIPCIAISAKKGIGLEDLKTHMFNVLDIIRVYTKSPGKKPRMDQPLILKRNSTVEDVARSIHKDFLEKLLYARIWGKKVFDGQKVKRDYVLEDGDIVELHI
ncbi:MAG: TGS domain-containing protein [Candidatus Aenigmatarchaeota archaeon]